MTRLAAPEIMAINGVYLPIKKDGSRPWRPVSCPTPTFEAYRIVKMWQGRG